MWQAWRTARKLSALRSIEGLDSVSIFFNNRELKDPWEVRITIRRAIDRMTSTVDEFREDGGTLEEAIDKVIINLKK